MRSTSSQFLLPLSLLLLASSLALPQAHGRTDEEPPAVQVSQKSLVPFLKQHCLRCHNEDDENGDFRIDTVAWSIKSDADAEKWQDVLDVLNSGEMPPESEPRPENSELVEVLAVLSRTLTKARALLSDSGSAVPIRRLNKREYINTMRHLFGLNLNDRKIPNDIRGEHFDTLGESQFFDQGSFETYLNLGTWISREGLRWSGQPQRPLKTEHLEPERKFRRISDKIPGYSSLPRAGSGKYLNPGGRQQARVVGFRIGPDPRASYRVKIHAGLVDNPHPLRRSVIVSESSGVLGVPGTDLGALRIHGTIDKPQTEQITIPYRALGHSNRVEVTISESKPQLSPRDFKNFRENTIKDPRQESIWIDWVEIEGPLYSSQLSVLGDMIAKSKAREVKDLKNIDLSKFLEQFTTEAFRRQKAKPEYVGALVEYIEQLQKSENVSDVDALSKAMGVVLASPGFLYLEEETQANSRKLSARSFATRLAYFLWSCPPDDELYRLAESGEIFAPEILDQQVKRMLDNEKADSFFAGFMSQWAELDRLDGVSVNVSQYPSYSSGYQFSIRREAVEFFKLLVKENLSVDQLVDSEFVVVNAFLAEHYGLPTKKYSNEFERVALAADDPRGGMITQAGFLTMGSDGNRTSPVIRGALLMDKLLNQPPPPPPPNVPELAEASDKPISNRKIVELHQKQTACASCHKRMDPIGFGLENFDVVGKWRDVEKVGDKEHKISASATLVSGVKFKNLKELKGLLSSQRHHLARGMIESLLSYGLGRNKSFSDQEAVEQILRQSHKTDFQLRDMIIGIVNSEPFQRK